MAVFANLREYLHAFRLLARVLILNLVRTAGYRMDTYRYGTDRHQYGVIIRPKAGQEKSAVIFFCHGGGWRQGFPGLFRFVGYYFADLGYTTILAGYRKVPRHVFPVQAEDTACALKAGIERLGEQGSFCDKAILAGHSAGAHLVTYLACSDILDKMGLDKKLIKGVISISGPINFAECKNSYVTRVINGLAVTEESKKQADPYLHLKKDADIPILCIHGDRDPIVEPANSVTFVNRINEIRDGLGKLIMVSGSGHNNINELFWKGLDEHKEMDDWIRGLLPD
jgi:acetyl esterase/lipase